jgi:ABC-type sulfate transport system permease subunit
VALLLSLLPLIAVFAEALAKGWAAYHRQPLRARRAGGHQASP